MEKLLVEVFDGNTATVIVQGDTPREFRKISSALRGASRSALESFVSNMREAPSVAEMVSPMPGIARPVFGPNNTLFGIDVTLGSTTAAGTSGDSGADMVGGYEWEMALDGLPPRLHATTDFLDVWGIAPESRDRVVYGPADFFGNMARISDIARLWQDLKVAKEGDGKSGIVVIRPAGSTQPRQVHYAQRAIETPQGLRVRGLARTITSDRQDAGVRTDMLDAELGRQVIGLTGMFGVVGDLSIPSAPCVLKWLTTIMPGIGHGVSTGQTPGIHPDDLPLVFGWIDQVRHGKPVTGSVRLRRATGGWLRANFLGQLLDREAFPTLGISLVYPEIAEEDVVDTIAPR